MEDQAQDPKSQRPEVIPTKEEQLAKFNETFDKANPIGVMCFMETDDSIEGYAEGNFSVQGLQAIIERATHILRQQLLENLLEGL